MTASRLVVVLGGTFDPVHLGHIAVADQARDLVGADEAWLIPSRVPPHRWLPVASAEDRLAMVEAAVRGRPRLRVLDIEVRRPGDEPSYTVDTLAELRRLHPGIEIWFVVGADAAREVRSWHRGPDLLAEARFLLVNRTGVPVVDAAEAASLGFAPERTRICHLESPPISATEVRARVAAGLAVTDLVGEAVAALIRERGLYRGHVG